MRKEGGEIEEKRRKETRRRGEERRGELRRREARRGEEWRGEDANWTAPGIYLPSGQLHWQNLSDEIILELWSPLKAGTFQVRLEQ